MGRKIFTALEFSVNKICMAQSEDAGPGINLISLESLTLEKPEDLVPSLEELSVKYGIKNTKVITSLPRYQVFLRKITVPPGTDEEIRSMLQFEADKYIPFSVNDAIIDFYSDAPLSQSSKNEIFLVAAKKDTIEKHLEVLKSAGIYPEKISVSSFALSKIIPQADMALVGVNGDSWEIGIFLDKKLFLSRGLAFTGGKSPDKKAENMAREIDSSFTMFNSMHKGVKLEKIYYFMQQKGEEISQNLKQNSAFNYEEFIFNTSDIISVPEDIDASLINKCLVSVGLLLPSQYQVNLLPGSIQDHYSQRKRKKMQLLISGIALGVLAATGIMFFGIKYFKSSESRAMMKKIEVMKPEILKLAKLDRRLNIVDGFKKNNSLILDVIKEVSGNLEKGVYIRQLNYDYEQNSVIIRGRTKSYAIASNVASKLAESGYFSQVVNKGAHAIKVGNSNLVDFEVVCMLKEENEKAK